MGQVRRKRGMVAVTIAAIALLSIASGAGAELTERGAACDAPSGFTVATFSFARA